MRILTNQQNSFFWVQAATVFLKGTLAKCIKYLENRREGLSFVDFHSAGLHAEFPPILFFFCNEQHIFLLCVQSCNICYNFYI